MPCSALASRSSIAHQSPIGLVWLLNVKTRLSSASRRPEMCGRIAMSARPTSEIKAHVPEVAGARACAPYCNNVAFRRSIDESIACQKWAASSAQEMRGHRGREHINTNNGYVRSRSRRRKHAFLRQQTMISSRGNVSWAGYNVVALRLGQ